ncbi:MAG TPA: hypothetical protein VGX76_17085 [Pirellulales bacterium]|nr:hypothetical protein [Pirellulales bacterium]
MSIPPSTPRSRWYAAGAAAWLPSALAAGAAIGCLAVLVQPHFAPLVLFPLLLGLSLAASLIVGLRVFSVAHAPTAWTGTFLASALVVGGQHYWSYRAARNVWAGQQAEFEKARQAFPEIANRVLSPPPADVGEYLRTETSRGRELLGYRVRGAALWGWWGLEAALVSFAALLPVVWALRQPYCTRCRRWLRTNRRGRVSAAVASELAGRCGLSSPHSAGAADYRVATCRAGCSPSLVELSWEKAGETGRAWLDAERRRAVAELLDRDEV